MFCSDFWALHDGYVILFWTFLNQPMVPLHIFAVKKSPHFCQLMEMMHASVRSRTWPGCMLQRLFQFVSLETDGPMVEKFNNWSSKILEDPWGIAIAAVAAASSLERCAKLLRGSFSPAAFYNFCISCSFHFLFCCFHVKQQISKTTNDSELHVEQISRGKEFEFNFETGWFTIEVHHCSSS